MNEVSCRMFQFCVELAAQHGFSYERLAEAVRQPSDLLHGRRKWYDWDEHLALLERLEQLYGGAAALEDAMRHGMYGRVVRPFTALVSYLTTPRAIYLAGFKWFSPSIFRHLSIEVEDIDSHTLRARIELPRSYRGSTTFFRLWRGGLRTAPLQLGLKEAIVHGEVDSHGADFTIILPERHDWPARLLRWAKAVVDASDVVDELARHEAHIREAYEELLEAHEASVTVLRRSERTQRTLLQNLPDLVVVVNRDGWVVDVTGSATHALYQPFRAALGHRLESASIPGSSPDLAERLWRDAHDALEHGTCRVYEFSLSSVPDRRHFEWRTDRIDAGSALCVARDITERRDLELQLVLADRMASIGMLAAGVAHEINNPLAYLLATAEVASRELASGEASREQMLGWMRSIREGAERIRDVVAEFRTVTRPDPPEARPVDVNALLDSVVRVCDHQVSHRASIVRRYGEVPPVRGLEARLAQAFSNLLLNAAQAFPANDPARNVIELVTSLHREGVAVEVRDTGQGIAPEVLPRIFDPFFTTKPTSGGTGLGLSIALRIVADHRGRIEVETERGKGSLFRVVLPAAAAEQAKAVLAPAATNGRARRKLLIVDDQPRVAESVKMLLSDDDVSTAHSGAEAISKALAERFDVVLCDLMMPGIDGIEVYRRIREARPGLEKRIVFMTGGAFTPEARAFLESVPNPRLEKPFTFEQLDGTLAKAAEEARDE